MTQEEEKTILDLLLTQDLQSGWKRINVIIGTSLYSPIRTISTLFGKDVEDNQWGRVGEIPNGNIDIESNLLRVSCKNNQVQALEILARSDSSINEEPVSKAQKKLNPIPKGTDET